MPDPGRSTDSRSVPSVTTTAASNAFTAPAGSFDPVGDIGRTLTGANLGAGKTIATVAANGASGTFAGGTAGVASGTATATVGPGTGLETGFRGWSPETAAEAGVYNVASRNAGAVDPGRPLKDTKLTLHRSR